MKTNVMVFAGAALLMAAGALAAENEITKPKTESERYQSMAAKAGRMAKKAKVQEQDADTPQPNPYSNLLVHQVLRRPVTWTLDAATCSLLKLKVTASGQGKNTLTVLQNRDGSLNYEMLDEVNGTAVDEKGGQYIFTYSNTSVFNSTAIFPAPLEPFSFKGPDLFQLIGTTPGAPSYSVYIYFNGRINADGSFTDLGTAASNDPNCDPI
ncbi:MAG TPA: hypothetical protein VIX89_15405 [Bryobacteraceae bacterium]